MQIGKRRQQSQVRDQKGVFSLQEVRGAIVIVMVIYIKFYEEINKEELERSIIILLYWILFERCFRR